MNNKVKILGFGGSLRQGSYSEMILQTSTVLHEALDVCPDEGEISVFEEIGDFPLFSQDLENNPPDTVRKFKESISEADAILIATPEYDYSVPGYLKNALDWASRPYGSNSFDDKPAAILSTSPGILGGVKAQYALRQVSVSLNLHLLNKPEVIISSVHEKIKDGKLIDKDTQDKIQELLVALCKWTTRLKIQN